MINRNQAIKIAKDFLSTDLEKEDWFIKVKPFVKAFVLYGSVAKGTNRPDSDMDILLILPLETEKEYTKGEYFYDYQGQKINIVLRSIEKLRKIAIEKTDLFQKEIFRKAEILFDVDGEISGLLKEINKEWKYKLDIKKIVKKLEDFYGFESPKFTVDILNSKDEFDKKRGYKTPDWFVGFADKNNIDILSPSTMEKESSHKKSEFTEILSHEICHIFNYELNKNPIKWVDEGVALFLSNQKNKNDFNKEDIELFFSTKLNSKNFNDYKGYTISYWAIKTATKIMGRNNILELVKIKADSKDMGRQLEEVIGLSKEDFIKEISKNISN